MRTVESLDGLERVLIEDANGNLWQHIPTLETRIPDGKRDKPHRMEGGWYDVSATVRVSPEQIPLPVKVLWE